MEEKRWVDRFKKNKKWENKAQEYVTDKDKTDELIKEAMEKAAGKSGFEEIYEKIQLSFELVKDYVSGSYREISKSTIISILGAIIYFVSPIDAIFDAIPVLGFLDDAAILGFVIRQVDSDIRKYRVWKAFQDDKKNKIA